MKTFKSIFASIASKEPKTVKPEKTKKPTKSVP